MSDNTCTADCVQYVTQQPDQGLLAIISSTSYDCDLTDPEPLAIGILLNNQSSDFEFVVSLSSMLTGDSFFFNIKLIGGLNANSNSQVIITNKPPGVLISLDPGNFQFSDTPLQVNIKLVTGLSSNDGTSFPLRTYVLNDNYSISILNCNADTYTVGNFFTRPSTISVSSNLISSTLCIGCHPNNNTIPRIQVEAQTLLNGSDIGDAVFTIYDEFTYYDKHKIPDNTCKDRQSIHIKTTIFRQCCSDVRMVSVVKGKGVTLWEKIQYLFKTEITNVPNVYIFYQNMIQYGMAKYILFRLLYGKFHINYLLGKYNARFLRKLSTSRFCAFSEFFTLYVHYENYFLYTN